ncbi:hypothetical protein M2459_001448 [Parabacteroides sp. PF5-5]|uniref:hypothetical protein n=1 Tax=unclassified Parabacteroides TaxID=2649774 RepID=UPI002474DAC5|nr:MULTISPECIES: hypothetical protein [unclassified Parabacteroides]MDH6334704.1 hypothetical protein [Parabacteroides sp. PF5-5]MDH6384212.1 hypothetical protein [Parabacteroides sp. PH5-17]MDH6304711.1 hypothetical protein [Parabacteroides sp. PH5-39]MDH6315674.1 hypothetical protein [Parabacteroides sp. PF5-13]MDH6319335.1 hypothetical protein [Parabacteroides sp. PH5-13]
MRKLSTRCMETVNKTKKEWGTEKSIPQKKTLDFLSQFARVYHAEPAMQEKLCGFVMN